MLTFEIAVEASGPLADPTLLERFDAEVSSALQELGALAQRMIVQATPRGISAGGGGLAGSITSELRGVPARREQVVSSSMFYAPIVELGRRPGNRWPPLAPIELWVRRKLHVPADRAAEVAFLVARKIGEEGTSGAHMFEFSFRQLRPIAERRFQQLGQQLEGRA